MDKAFSIQKQIRHNANTVNSYLTDLQNWEEEMKRKEAALNGQFEQDPPPIRSRPKKGNAIQVIKKQEARILSSDYNAWEKFDVDKACQEVDMEDIGPSSLDSMKSQSVKQEQLREEAQYEKERGNAFVKQQKWDEAIACYNRAIELVNDDAIYYANRGLCYLKKDSLHLAERDCSAALRLEPSYVKALQRRGAARERLGALRGAAADVTRVLELEPHNASARRQLHELRARMGTKGSKSKSSSPLSTPTKESNPTENCTKEENKPEATVDSMENKWRDAVGDNITIIKPVKKPPHLRSKRPLKTVPIEEIQLGKTIVEKPPTRLKIEEIEDNCPGSNETKPLERLNNGQGDFGLESMKLSHETMMNEKNVKNVVPPANSVQFMMKWKELQGDDEARVQYLCSVPAARIPALFASSLESALVSELVELLAERAGRVSHVAEYLLALTRVPRFGALVLFLTDGDKRHIRYLVEHCKTVENCSDEVIEDLKNKYEF